MVPGFAFPLNKTAGLVRALVDETGARAVLP
jgi:hypothetical protein